MHTIQRKQLPIIIVLENINFYSFALQRPIKANESFGPFYNRSEAIRFGHDIGLNQSQYYISWLTHPDSIDK